MDMAKTVAVIQSSYLPWKGYFDIIHDADVFVFYDDVKYTKNDWRNRNRVKMNDQVVWLTIPIGKDAVHQRICDVTIQPGDWQEKHWRTIRQCYGKCEFFHEYAPVFEQIFCRRQWTSLSELNQALIRQICEWLKIDSQLVDSREFPREGSKQDALIALLKKVDATDYVSGPAAGDYIDPMVFEREGIELTFKDYGNYPEYPQGEGGFEHGVSVIDLLFRFGADCPRFIWGGGDQ